MWRPPLLALSVTALCGWLLSGCSTFDSSDSDPYQVPPSRAERANDGTMPTRAAVVDDPVLVPEGDTSQPEINSKRMKINRLHVDGRTHAPTYFNQAIPHVVHQIWFGNKDAMPEVKVQRWQSYCRTLGAQYRLWGDDDLAEIKQLLPVQNRTLFDAFHDGKEYYGASDLLRVTLLRQIGGIYADVDIGPPMVDGVIRPLGDFFPLQNLVAMGEHHPRNIVSGSIFVANGFMMATPDHPLLTQLEDSVLANVESLYGYPIRAESRFLPGPQFMTGPYFVSENIFGPMTVAPISYFLDLGMVD